VKWRDFHGECGQSNFRRRRQRRSFLAGARLQRL
jgi:hypothetical protein